MKTLNYFEEAQEAVNQKFHSADGWDYADDWGADGDMQSNYGADGADDAGIAASKAQLTKSQPFIVIVKNTTTADIQDVVILDAFNKVDESANAYGNTAGIYIAYGLSNISYKGFLRSISSNQIFEAGITRVAASASSDSNAQAQVLKTVTFTQSDMNGALVSMPITPQKDSYQYQNNQVDIAYQYLVNALTKITISEVLASTTVTISIYPKSRSSQFDALRGGTGVKSLGNPHINKMLNR